MHDNPLTLPLSSLRSHDAIVVEQREWFADEELRRALALAVAAGDRAQGTTSPNPPVGAAVVALDGEVVGVGATEPVGGPHAEVMALRQAGAQAEGATMVVTLEPCAHTGRTGPCTQAIIDAGIARVLYCHKDPSALAGGGAQVLEHAGVESEYLGLAVKALQPWLHAQHSQRPYVVAKIAQSADGFVAAADGSSQWITGAAARQAGHRFRAQADAIMVGTGTVLADNPTLSARDGHGNELEKQPRPIVVGTRTIPSEAMLWQRGVEQFSSPAQALDWLWDHGERLVLVEGGPDLITSMLTLDLVDELHLYLAPLLLGAGKSSVGHVAGTLEHATRFYVEATEMFGQDVAVVMRRTT
ncbi:bifunctional diaminohydroxyphosphoribosylaminopyrimidine deaminase/5-amino-6-(5-phosphoribosylamino)uracil reductase RibD [Corynebacterium pseudopelargi]|uniref:Riboflavin biosynthesis protein RibD n=1 Tax=Corynebacterium pseudopelargi TaxID=2080757 RepID=A0A3G6IU54_9CORY|nr:bifunctional diaminohydroxyphosphoribosylaminopyrimidine deaminase/5-amino-6-(5-phosphoribosylamino)uracil reductase RibD [Corynebacterium pseudopelargi]AZA09202.1 Riboflavin biosynthesis protein RibD [Corynebacterium pseudopelargi]